MTSLRDEDNRMNIAGEDELGVGASVEEEKEVVLGVRRHYAPECLGCEPADAIKTVRQQETCVDSNAHSFSFLIVSINPITLISKCSKTFSIWLFCLNYL